MLLFVIVAVVADGGLFLIDPQYGAMGAVVAFMALFIASFF